MKSLIAILLVLFSYSSIAEESICYGETKNGRLENGVQLPAEGKNFTSYSFVGESLGRTYC